MTRFLITSVVIFSTLFCPTLNAAEQFLIMKIGPTWPKELLNSKKPTAWDAAAISGLTFDNKVSIGGGIDFLWNSNIEEKKISENRYQIESEEKTFMFPISGFLEISPLPEMIANPCLSSQIGLNTMYFSHKDNKKKEETPDSLLEDENGWYMGFYFKLSLDARFNISQNTGLFAGVEYQWTEPTKLDSDSNDSEFFRREMNAFGIRMGLRVIF